MKLPIHSLTLTGSALWARIRPTLCNGCNCLLYGRSEYLFRQYCIITLNPATWKWQNPREAYCRANRTKNNKTIAQRDNQYCWLASRENWEPMSYIGAVIKEIVWRYHDRIGRRWLKSLTLNSFAPGAKLVNLGLQFQISKFQTHSSDKHHKYGLWYCYQVNAKTPHWSLVNIGSGNGLVPSGNKSVHKPMLTQMYIAIWGHHITIS